MNSLPSTNPPAKETPGESGKVIVGGLVASVPPPVSPAAPAVPLSFLSDSYIFHWELKSFRSDIFFVVAVAICLGVGLVSGHPAAGMIAAGGAMTTGFGAKQTIDGTPLLPMIFCAIGMAVSTFIGMVAGHENYALIAIASAFGFGYGMLSKRQAGYGWVGQQCVVTLLVASAFPFSPKDALVRGGLIFAGGAAQIVCASILLRSFNTLSTHLRELARYARAEEVELRAAYLGAVQVVRHRRLRDSPVPYAFRLAVVLAVSTAIYQQLHFASGYWIPMTALLVMKPGIADTANRAIARTVGTLAGAVLASTFLVYVHPPPAGLASLVLLFTWLAYGLNNVNYALFSVCITSYVVFLLSLADISGLDIARRRAVCTIIGGVIALTVRLLVIRHRRKQDAVYDAPGRVAGMAPGTSAP